MVNLCFTKQADVVKAPNPNVLKKEVFINAWAMFALVKSKNRNFG